MDPITGRTVGVVAVGIIRRTSPGDQYRFRTGQFSQPTKFQAVTTSCCSLVSLVKTQDEIPVVAPDWRQLQIVAPRILNEPISDVESGRLDDLGSDVEMGAILTSTQ